MDRWSSRKGYPCLPVARRSLLLLSIGLALSGCTTLPPPVVLCELPPVPVVATQPSPDLPLLPTDFPELFDSDPEAAMRLFISVAAERARLYRGLREKHLSLTEYVEALPK